MPGPPKTNKTTSHNTQNPKTTQGMQVNQPQYNTKTTQGEKISHNTHNAKTTQNVNNSHNTQLMPRPTKACQSTSYNTQIAKITQGKQVNQPQYPQHHDHPRCKTTTIPWSSRLPKVSKSISFKTQTPRPPNAYKSSSHFTNKAKITYGTQTNQPQYP